MHPPVLLCFLLTLWLFVVVRLLVTNFSFFQFGDAIIVLISIVFFVGDCFTSLWLFGLGLLCVVWLLLKLLVVFLLLSLFDWGMGS